MKTLKQELEMEFIGLARDMRWIELWKIIGGVLDEA